MKHEPLTITQEGHLAFQRKAPDSKPSEKKLLAYWYEGWNEAKKLDKKGLAMCIGEEFRSQYQDSFFALYHKGKLSNCGSFEAGLMKLFYLADKTNKEKLIYTFTDYFNLKDLKF